MSDEAYFSWVVTGVSREPVQCNQSDEGKTAIYNAQDVVYLLRRIEELESQLQHKPINPAAP